jgi:hypothetical protein
MNGLLKTLIKPDWNDNPKRSDILLSANLLQIGEFQLIQLAYKAWYQEELPEERINKIFNEYMVKGIVPIWVSYYAKDILKLSSVNKLKIHNDKYHIYDHEFGSVIKNEKQRKKIGFFFVFIIVLIFISSYFVTTDYKTESTDFLFPPYIDNSIVYPELEKK